MNIIQKRLSPDEYVISSHDVSLVQGLMRSSRKLIIIEKSRDLKALFVLSDNVDYTLPIDSDFKFDLVSEGKSKGDVVYINISYQKLKLLVEMPPSSKTNGFINDLLKSMEYQSKRKTAGDYSWLDKYSSSSDMSHRQDNQGVVMDVHSLLDSNDGIPRQSIAKGAVQPVAARESIIKYQMDQMEQEYTYIQEIKIFIGTWNTNGQSPSGVLNEWLSSTAEPPHVYAIGFQELDLSTEALVWNSPSQKEGEWLSAVTRGLHPGAVYTKICLVRLVGMMLIVFVEENLAKEVHNVASDTVGTGIMKLGNKGGVSIRMDLHTTSFCFVNSHLAAHTEELERRNQDYRDIDSRIAFTGFLPPKSIKDHDQIYWLGDLNYRITELDLHQVKQLIHSGKYEKILEHDQLKRQHVLGRIFNGYKEGPISFRPTYKYDVGTDNWDSSEKSRAPAWCDRVLYKGSGIKSQIEYKSIPALKISDHKPVYALFNSEIGIIDIVKYRRIHEEVMKRLDRLENEFLPSVMVDTNEIVFDTIRFLEPQTKTLIIANTGQVPVQFEFIKKLDDTKYCKDWLHIEPYTQCILPGEKCDVQLQIYVDKRCASKMNSGNDKLNDILILHLDGGKDVFIEVKGTYERSVFGCSIELLVHLDVPLREVGLDKLIELENSKDLSNSPAKYSVPKEIWFLVDHLYRHGLKQQNLFEHPGLPSEILLIRDWLDNSKSDYLKVPGGIHSVAESLILLLESTAEPIIPYNIHNLCLSAASSYMQCKQLVSSLPMYNKNVFLYLCSFLQELLSHSNENQLDSKKIATIFGQIFLRDLPRSRNDPHNMKSRSNHAGIERQKTSFVYHFLVNDDISNLISNNHINNAYHTS